MRDLGPVMIMSDLSQFKEVDLHPRFNFTEAVGQSCSGGNVKLNVITVAVEAETMTAYDVTKREHVQEKTKHRAREAGEVVQLLMLMNCCLLVRYDIMKLNSDALKLFNFNSLRDTSGR